ncbi:hypothetical protein GCM10022403_065190 [Streptomyces coacervatus]|uniref:DUF6879 domain-containing protein n=1 Tax=Streptomyces coacervatus TaxID=647381 RepID=A0ABP7IN34_9ACTN|nr:hypothetical protein [Streptomyces coacervatus]MDF2268680.1 hypothetical protein [Streptomyces coacervatus]
MSGASLGAGQNGSVRQRLGIPKLFLKIVITASAAGAGFFVSMLLHGDNNNIWQWVASIVFGSATLIVQYLVDFGERLEVVEKSQRQHNDDMKQTLNNHHSEMREAVEKSFAKINEATELFSKVDGSVLRSEEVTRLVKAYTQVGDESPGIVKSFAEEELKRLAELMEDLISGRADSSFENHEWLIDLATCVKKTLYATSTTVDRDFWSSEPAKRYLSAQEKAIKTRGVEVRRLFLVDEPEQVTEALEQLCVRQRRYGIDARIGVQSQLDPGGTVMDFIIFDGELCYETRPDNHVRPDMTMLRMKQEHVEDRVNQFNELWAATEPEHEPEPEQGSVRRRLRRVAE